jgi:hypothetical protein
MEPCLINHCQNGGLCFLDYEGHSFCRCPDGYAGEDCDIMKTQMSSNSRNVGLIAGLSVLGAVLLLTAAAVIFYFFVYPRIKVQKKYEAAEASEISASNHGLTKFDQTSTRLTKFWPRNPERYTPETYSSSQDAPGV